MPITRPKPKAVKKVKIPAGYDSKFEYDMHKRKLKGCNWKPDSVSYAIPHKYKPDAKFVRPDGTEVLIELKGRHGWAKQSEMGKYKHVRESLLPHQELVFVLYEHNMRFPNARRRLDGSYMTYEEWMETNNFTYYYPDTVPRSWGIRR